MKGMWIAAWVLWGGFASAEQICQDLPDVVSYSKISINFDGSVYLEDPSVFASGEYVALVDWSSGTAKGLCRILGKELVSFKHGGTLSPKTLTLTSEGSFSYLYKKGQYQSMPWIVCK